MKRPALAAAVIAALTLTLTGCSATPAEPTVEPLGAVSTIDEVVDAFIAAGGVCNWKQTDKVTAAVASGECSDSTVIMLFQDRSDREGTVSTLQALKLDGEDLSLLVGENWIINSDEAEDMQPTLGGEWVTK